MDAPYLTCGKHSVKGTVAEVLSVLDESAIWRDHLGRPLSLEEIVAALDPRRPSEERVGEAIAACRKLKDAGRIAKWIPWYDRLFEHEYRREFFVGYRDHSIHTLQVVLLGFYLFETVTSLREPLLKLLRRKTSGAGLSEVHLFIEWWLLASIWHDSAYAFEAESFLADTTLRSDILQAFSRSLGRDPFSNAFSASGLNLTSQELRKAYQQGSYYPLEVQSVSQLLDNTLFKGAGNDLWHRLGIGLGFDHVSKELDLVTTQDPVGRAPYHDHGIVAAALLSTFIEEAERFLASLARGTSQNAQQNAVEALAEQAWLEFSVLEGVIAMAIEAIAFHNITFSQLRASVAGKRLIPEGYDSQVSIAYDPHLFFIAITDTLQDWDRHHFAPAVPGSRYRPAKRADQILIQGDGDKVRVALEEDPQPAKTIGRLFAGWLNPADVNELFADNPRYSRPERLHAGVQTKLDRLERSYSERLRLESVIRDHAEEARRLLIQDESDSILRVSTLFRSISRQISDAAVLTHSDKEAVEAFLADSGLRRLQAQSYALIRKGSRLELGEVVRGIGEGGFGRVFEVRAARQDGKSTAFKVFHDRDLGDAEKLRLFRRGYEAMKSLIDHPNVVSVLSFSEVPLGFFMDFVPGPDLENGIGQFESIHERLMVGLKIVNTVADAHNRPVRVLHRDIKPANVLLDATLNFEPILTDFDLAWIESHRTTLTRQLYANFHYGAPEQFEPRWREYRERPAVDTYALGALLYFLSLKQAPPHYSDWGSPHWVLIEERLSPELPAKAVDRFVDLLKRLTVVEPTKRLDLADQVAAELTRIVALASSGDQWVSLEDWSKEVVYKSTGATTFHPRQFPSRSGNVVWSLNAKWQTRDRSLVAEATLSLSSRPSFEGSNYQKYRAAVARRIDERLKSFSALWSDVQSVRTGFPTEGSNATIRLEGLPCTLEAAAAFAHLVVQINRSIEA